MGYKVGGKVLFTAPDWWGDVYAVPIPATVISVVAGIGARIQFDTRLGNGATDIYVYLSEIKPEEVSKPNIDDVIGGLQDLIKTAVERGDWESADRYLQAAKILETP